MTKHIHHIIPRYLGGTDDPKNLIELTIEEHAEAHKLLFEKYGNWQDEIAWKGLLKMIDKTEIIRQSQSKALKDYHSRPEIKQKYKELNEKRWNDPSHIKKVSDSSKKQWKNPNFIKMHKYKMKEHNKKLWLNELSKNKIIYSNRNNNRKVISLYDGKITTWSNKIKHENKTGYIHIWTEL